LVEVPDDEVLDSPSSAPGTQQAAYVLPLEVIAMARVAEERLDRIRHTPLPEEADLLAAKQIDRIAAMDFRDEIRNDDKRRRCFTV
jgi:hypothetical protein